MAKKETKDLIIEHAPNSPLYCLKFQGGGELPDLLKTLYTSSKEAAKARDLYLAGKLKKVEPIQRAVKPKAA